MNEATEADFAALWERIKARHDAKHGEGDAKRLVDLGWEIMRQAGVPPPTEEQPDE